MKKQYIESLNAGDYVDDIFVLSESFIAQKKDGSNYLNITVSDKTGKIKGVMWDNIEQITDKSSSSDFVHLQGTVSEYKGTCQLIIKKMDPYLADLVDLSDFLPQTSRNIDNMLERLKEITSSMEKNCYKKLFDEFWNDKNFVQKFKTAPAAKTLHHAYIGGLIEHSLSIAILSDKIAGHYGGIDRDLLLAGGILHDVGKIKEFEYIWKIEYSDEGRLLNHIVIGLQMVEDKIRKIKDFPEKQAMLLKHMIISHHGHREFGSPEPPKIVEAVLLNYIDEIDSKINGIRDFIASENTNSNWTSYHRAFGRYFYIS